MIPVNEPLLGSKEVKNLVECVKSGWISSKGKYIDLFEKEFAKFCGTRYGITVTSGTTALHLALLALNIKKDDEVIMPTFTMAATACAVIYTGAKPIFVDSEPRTGNMDVTKIEKFITSKTKAIMPVHIYGHPVDMESLIKISKKYRLFIIEDAAEAHGAEYRGKKCGSFGDVGCFSFYANKIITTGEGGMLVTNNKKLAIRARRLKDLAHSPKKRFLHTDLAYNYRMTNMQAAIGLAQLNRIEEFIKKKRYMAMIYNKNLKGVKGLCLPIEENRVKNVYWMYTVIIDKKFGINRDKLMRELFKKGIETRTFFMPMHRQPFIKKLGLIAPKKKFPVADDISKKGLYLPSGLALRKKDILCICAKIKEIQRKFT